MKYAIVIPAKDEELTLENTLDSVLSQSFLPEICLVVDDGSTDSTADIVNRKMKENPIVNYIKIKGEKTYKLGGHVIEVFNAGKKHIESLGIEYDYIVKLDADLVFENNVMKAFIPYMDKAYGIVSGTPYYMEEGKKIYDRSPAFHSRGQFKVYNKKCLDEIGGVPLGLGWDTADNVKAMQKGWKTLRIDEIDYLMERKIGGKHNLKKGKIKHGIGAYNLRYSPLYLTMRIIHDLFKPPLVIGSLYYMYGYFKSLFSGSERVLSKDEGKLLRKLFWSGFNNRFKSKDFYILQKLSGKK